MKKSELDKLKVLLEEQKVMLEQEIYGLDEHAKPVTLDQQSVGRVSRIDAIQQQQMAQSNIQLAKKKLILTLSALKRIEEDDFGYCEECGETIDLKRLSIKPEAEFCIQCQQQLENQ